MKDIDALAYFACHAPMPPPEWFRIDYPPRPALVFEEDEPEDGAEPRRWATPHEAEREVGEYYHATDETALAVARWTQGHYTARNAAWAWHWATALAAARPPA